MVLSDTELVREAQRADAASLGILLGRHQAALYATALRLLGHGPEAQDAVQETFLIALRDIGQVRNPEAIGGWLRTVVRNVCLRRLGNRREVIPLDDPASRLDKKLSESSAEEAIDRLAMREWVWTALSELPEALRVTAMLRYFSSYTSYEEISAVLGVPVGTVKSRLNQVKVKLAEALLRTAGLEHDEARVLTESQTRYWTAALDEMNQGDGYEMFASPFSDDAVWAYADGTVGRGRAFLAAFLKDDVETGVKLHLNNVLVTKDITVIENDFENPHDDPFHCPPATSMVFFYRDGRIHRARQYYAPRPGPGGGE